jgi:hypothetical protein
MKTRPILFSAPMISALLGGRKTQTRRDARVPRFQRVSTDPRDLPRDTLLLIPEWCPYGKPGDLLWVREAWCSLTMYDALPPRQIPVGESVEYLFDSPTRHRLTGRGRPSIHMPRWASRLTLRITNVRVERLQDISEADAIAEGIERIDDPRGIAWKSYEIIHKGKHKGTPHPHAAVPNRSPVTSYRELWEAINGLESWAANPWCWAITFEAIKSNVDEVLKREDGRE